MVDCIIMLLPPPKPNVWVSGWTLYTMDNGPTVVRKLNRLFNHFNMSVSKKDDWTWSIAFCIGPHLLEGECAVMSERDGYIVDIMALGGDRRQWNNVLQNIRQQWMCGAYFKFDEELGKKTPEFMYEWLASDDFVETALQNVGVDVRPSALLPLLTNQDENIVRMALRALALCHTPFECPPSVICWAQRQPANLMQREMKRWSKQIVTPNSSL